MGSEHADISKIWPQWKPVSVLGHGSYGSVYQVAKDDYGIRAYSAVKVIHVPQNEAETRELEMSGMDLGSVRTFYQSQVSKIADEIRVMETLESAPNIVSIKDHYIEEEQDGVGWNIYIRMELLEPLDHYAQTHGDLSEADVIRLGCDICTALVYCGSRKIIHRDIKPSNVFVDQFGSFKLGDFGIARRMNEGSASVYSMKGTVKFMAPEVAKGQSYGSTVDIYSLGIMMYWFLNHHRYPFEPRYPQQLTPDLIENATARRLGGDILPPPDMASAQLSDIILKACRPDPAGRWQTPQEMLNALHSVQNGTYTRATTYAKGGNGSALGSYSGQMPRTGQGPSTGNYMRQGPSTGSYNRQGPSTGSYNRQGPSTGSYNRQGPSTGSYNRQGSSTGNYTGQGPSSGNYAGQGGSTQKPKKKKTGLIIGIAAALFAAAVIFFLLQTDDGTKPEQTEAVETSSAQQETPKATESTSDAGLIDPDTLKKNVEITDYPFYNWTWSSNQKTTSGEEYSITNNNSVPVTVSIDASLVNEEGSNLYGSRTVWYIAPGDTKLTNIYVNSDDKVTDAYYDYTVQKADESDPDITAYDTSGVVAEEISRSGKTVTFRVTNNSDESRENITIGILKFVDGDLNGTDTNDISSLGPGESVDFDITDENGFTDDDTFIVGPGQYDDDTSEQ